MKRIILFSLLISSFFTYADFSVNPIKTSLKKEIPETVLFVGNSYLYYNDSIHNHVRRMAEEKFKNEFRYKSSTIGGSKLHHHNLSHLLNSKNIGVKKPFDLVILQGGSSEPLSKKSRTKFKKTVKKFNKNIVAAGAETALYMTHAYVKPHPKYAENMINDVYKTYVEAGNSENILVIPVGLAFENAYKNNPNIELHKPFDGTHPSLLGTYLAACVVFGSIYGSKSFGIDYNYYGSISNSDKKFLQRIADETLLEFYKK